MFDVLDVWVPAVNDPEFEYDPPDSLLGDIEDRHLSFRGTKVGRYSRQRPPHSMLIAKEAVSGWSRLVCGRDAFAASGTDSAWAAYLEAFARLLNSSPDWLVVFEADCDQSQLERIRLSSSDLIE